LFIFVGIFLSCINQWFCGKWWRQRMQTLND